MRDRTRPSKQSKQRRNATPKKSQPKSKVSDLKDLQDEFERKIGVKKWLPK